MGSEDEAEQSFGRPYRQTNGRSKRTCRVAPHMSAFKGKDRHAGGLSDFRSLRLAAYRTHLTLLGQVT